MEDLSSQIACFERAVAEDFFDVIRVGGQFGSAGPRGREVIPVVLKERLFQVAITQAAGAQAVLKISGHGGRSDEFEQLDGEVFVGIGFGFVRGTAVHDQAHDFFALGLFGAKDLDGVAVALAHFLAVAAGHNSGFVADAGFGHDEGLAVSFVEFDGDVAGDFDVLFLVAAHGDEVGIVNQNVGGHKDRIGEDAMVGGNAVGDFILVAVASFEQAHRGDGGEYPGQFGDGRHVGLPEQERFRRVESAGQEIQRDVQGVLAALGGVEEGGHGMVVGDEIESLALVLQFDGGFHHAKIIAQVKSARGLDAG